MLAHQSCTAPGPRNPAVRHRVGRQAAATGQRGGGRRLTTTSSPSMRTADPRTPSRGATPPQPGVDRAAAGRDLEVPLVPRTAEERVRLAERGAAVAQLDAGRDAPARA